MTQCLAPCEAAAAMELLSSAFNTLTAAFALPCCFFFIFFFSLSSLSRHCDFRTAGMTVTSTCWVSSVIFSSSKDLLASSSATILSKRSPSCLAFWAAAPVAATIRLTPLAMAFSSRIANVPASAVFVMWVPPQNSTDWDRHSSFEGDSSKSPTDAAPTVTTRTGSGYTSPATARTPVMLIAVSSGTAVVVTGVPDATTPCTKSSTRLSFAMLTLSALKSKRRLSAVTREPR
mmetsp:Transcript_118299/g.346555  ORF Transcript_118299/g.346555 Transcript_118299/m.346555 type:complete len:232 (-) Transcript_118299:1854-2549(-)